jgi:hypothetical protein
MFPHLPWLAARRAPLFVLLPLLFSGCGRYTHTKQCRALIAQINPALDDVLTITHGVAGNAGSAGATGSGGYVAAAGRYERLAKQLGPMEFGSEEMAKSVAEYAGILSSTAQGLRALAAALDSNNAIEADKNNRELERLVAHERAVVGRMDAWCQP